MPKIIDAEKIKISASTYVDGDKEIYVSLSDVKKSILQTPEEPHFDISKALSELRSAAGINDRVDKLSEYIHIGRIAMCDVCRKESDCPECENDRIAEYLILLGAEFPVHCRECEFYKTPKSHPGYCNNKKRMKEYVHPDYYCPDGKTKGVPK